MANYFAFIAKSHNEPNPLMNKALLDQLIEAAHDHDPEEDSMDPRPTVRQ